MCHHEFSNLYIFQLFYSQVRLIKQSFEQDASPPLKHTKSPTKIVLIQQGSPIQSSYLRMLRNERTDNHDIPHSGELPTISYPFGSCICLVCGTMFTSASGLVDHQEKCIGDNTPHVMEERRDHIINHGGRDNNMHHVMEERRDRNNSDRRSEEKRCQVCKAVYIDQCQHCQQAPQLTLVQQSNDVQLAQQSDVYDEQAVHANNTSALGFKDENEICQLPPPPHTEPNKPLPYRIDFLLQSGVIKHARMNNRKNGSTDSSPLYFENKRPRKPRTHFTISQIDDLEKVFVDKKYLSVTERSTLAYELGLQEEQVKNWFQNRRSRWRKDCKMESEHAPSQVPQGVSHPYAMQYANDNSHSLNDENSHSLNNENECQSPAARSPTMLPSFPDKPSDSHQSGLQT